jgi:hypothetical protein
MFLQIIASNEERITGMNTDQLFSGQRSDGSKLPDYSPVSVEVFGKPAGPIRLYDEGNFYRGFFLKTDRFPVLFDSRDSKTEMLAFDYGDKIFGLTQENKKDLVNHYIKDQVLAYYRKLMLP